MTCCLYGPHLHNQSADTPKGLGRDAAIEHKCGQPHCHPIGTGSLFRPCFSMLLCKFKLELSKPDLPVQNPYAKPNIPHSAHHKLRFWRQFLPQLNRQRQEVLNLAELNLDSQNPETSRHFPAETGSVRWVKWTRVQQYPGMTTTEFIRN